MNSRDMTQGYEDVAVGIAALLSDCGCELLRIYFALVKTFVPDMHLASDSVSFLNSRFNVVFSAQAIIIIPYTVECEYGIVGRRHHRH